METFSALLAICVGNSPVPGEFPTQRPVTRSFDVFFDLRPNKRLSKQWWGWWFETPSRPLWRHRNGCLSLWCRHQDLISLYSRLETLYHPLYQIFWRDITKTGLLYHAIKCLCVVFVEVLILNISSKLYYSIHVIHTLALALISNESWCGIGYCFPKLPTLAKKSSEFWTGENEITHPWITS